MEDRRLIKVLHVTAGLSLGGAERILSQLANHQNSNGQIPIVLNLLEPDHYSLVLQAHGIKVLSVYRTRPKSKYLGIFKQLRFIWRLAKRERPAVIHTWLYPADILGGIVGRLMSVPVIWGIFTGETDRSLYRFGTHLAQRCCAALSGFVPAAIVSVSARGRRTHLSLGYDSSKICYIPLGFALENIKDGGGVQSESNDDHVYRIGMLGRLSKEKNPGLLIQAINQLAVKGYKVVLVLAGANWDDPSNRNLREGLERQDLAGVVSFVGKVKSISQFFSETDLFCLISNSEGFPTVVGEAMLHRKPCLVSDTGDAKILLGSMNQIVEDDSVGPLIEALERMLCLAKKDREEIGTQNRLRVERHFHLEKMLSRYDRVYQCVLNQQQVEDRLATETRS